MNERDLIQKWMAWKEEYEQKQFSQKTLAESAGISPTYLSSIMTGIRNAGSKTVERIAEAFGVTLAEFYSGPPEDSGNQAESGHSQRPPDAAMFFETPAPREKPAPPGDFEEMVSGGESRDDTGLKLFRSSPDEIERLFGSFGYPLRDDTSVPYSPATPQPEYDLAEVVPASGQPELIPLLSRVPEGNWREWLLSDSKQASGRIPSPISGRRLFGVPVTDDSMSPILERGALALVDPEHSRHSLGGGIGVVAHRGCFLVRRVYAVGESLVLVPVNPDWFPEVIPAPDARIFSIVLFIPEETGRM